MYCTHCGSEIAEGDAFCQSCGAPIVERTREKAGKAVEIADRPQPIAAGLPIVEETMGCEIAKSNGVEDLKASMAEAAEQNARAQAKYQEERKKADEHAAAAAQYREIADYYMGSLIGCAIASAVLLAAIMLILLSGGIYADLNVETAQNDIAVLVAYGLAAVLLPFGLAPIFHWFHNHSFVVLIPLSIIALVMLFIAAFFAILFIALISGPFYIIYALARLKANRKRELKEQAIADKHEAKVAKFVRA